MAVMNRSLCAGLWLLLGAAALPSTAGASAGLSLAKQAEIDNPARYQQALRQGAQILVTPDLRSFYVLWLPDGVTPATARGMIVTLHGHSSWATDEFILWQPHAARRGFGIIALQWWFGGGDHNSEYYTLDEMFPLIETILRDQGVRQGTMLLHGFSRGSTNTYALTAMDRAGSGFIRMTIANAGAATADYPPIMAVTNGAYGPAPFAGSQWVLFCGQQDPHPDRAGCPAMARTQRWLVQLGGRIQRTIEDPASGHGGFHRNPANIEAALDAFDRLLREDPPPQPPAAAAPASADAPSPVIEAEDPIRPARPR